MPYNAGETVGAQEILFSESRGLKLGEFAGLGGSLDFYGNWVPAKTLGNNDDPYTAAARIMAVAGYLANTQVPLQRARRIAMRDTKEHFDKEESPEGDPWPALSDAYAAYKHNVEQYPEAILVRSGHLKDAATSEDAWIVIGEVLVFDPAVLPQDDGFNYGAFHQGGTESRPEHVLGGVFEFQKGKGQVQVGEKSIIGVPPRPFIGLSDEAIEEIAAEFEAWFATAEVVFDGPLERFGSNVRGTFPIIGYGPTEQPRLSTGQFGRKL